jgi:recombinational DNA repair protein (RecF pathway)
LWLEGYNPNLATDSQGQTLSPEKTYNFDYQSMAFSQHLNGVFNAVHIKLLRIAAAKRPDLLQKVQTKQENIEQTNQLIKTIIKYHN